MKRKLRNTHSHHHKHHLSLGSGDLLLSDNDSDSPAPACGRDSASTKEQDRFLPIANVSRIMKRSLPANAKISMDAKEVVQECASEFISFITGEASDKCQREKRKTINGDDLLWAMTTLGFDSYVSPLKAYLNRYRETEGDKARAGSAARHGEPTTSSNDQKLGSTTAVADLFSSNTVPTIASSARIPGGFGIPGEFFSLGPSSAAVEGCEQRK